jgi:hypothetical protein
MIAMRAFLAALSLGFAIDVHGATFASALTTPGAPTPADAVVLNLTMAPIPTFQIQVAPLSVTVSASVIGVTYAGQTPVGPPPPPVPVQTPLGRFGPGHYQVNVYVQPVAFWGGPPVGAPILEQTAQFDVVDMPMIPTLGSGQIALLMLLVMVAAVWGLRRYRCKAP